MSEIIKKKLIYGDKQNQQPYFYFGNQKHFLDDISTEGHDLTCFTNCGYFGGFKLTGFEYDIEDFVILEVL